MLFKMLYYNYLLLTIPCLYEPILFTIHIFTKDLFKVQPTPWASPNTNFINQFKNVLCCTVNFKNYLLFIMLKKCVKVMECHGVSQ